MYRNLAYGRKTDSLNVVLIDGNHGMRSILTTILKSNGITGIRAHGNANRAMSDMLERVPDAVLPCHLKPCWTVYSGSPATAAPLSMTEAATCCRKPMTPPILRESTRAGG